MRHLLGAFVKLSLVKIEVGKVRKERWFHFFVLDFFASNPTNPGMNHYFFYSMHGT